jgi:hypothetical protein
MPATSSWSEAEGFSNVRQVFWISLDSEVRDVARQRLLDDVGDIV